MYLINSILVVKPLVKPSNLDPQIANSSEWDPQGILMSINSHLNLKEFGPGSP